MASIHIFTAVQANPMSNTPKRQGSEYSGVHTGKSRSSIQSMKLSLDLPVHFWDIM